MLKTVSWADDKLAPYMLQFEVGFSQVFAPQLQDYGGLDAFHVLWTSKWLPELAEVPRATL